MKNILLSIVFCFSVLIHVFAQIPTGYYNGTETLTGTGLQQKLHDIIKGHNSQSYSSLLSHYQSTDKKSNGKVWDMYSDNPSGTPPYEFSFNDNCGNYSGEGDCYNREHSFPQSWFNSGSPMQSDLFHVVPTDGYVNGRRSNYPFGEVDAPVWTSQNGSRLGPSVSPGYTATVFEPIDAYKGDFARTYFYMATRYYTEDNSWPGSDMVDGSQLKTWALNVLKKWHEDDPVSQKEIARNNAVYLIQDNRNPFIDHPEFTAKIWGSTPSSINEFNSETENITFFPNPAHDFIFISSSFNQPQKIVITIYDVLGKQAGSFQMEQLNNRTMEQSNNGTIEQLNNGTIELDLSNIPRGFYIMEYGGKLKKNSKLVLN